MRRFTGNPVCGTKLILAAGRVSNSVAENLDVLKRLLESPIAER
jgi:hypothetical protein